jgi:superfamily II DNA or RNA helicase
LLDTSLGCESLPFELGLGETAPAYPSAEEFIRRFDLGIVPRPYQVDAFLAIFAKFMGGESSTLLVLPTGSGKTVVFGLVAKYVIEKLGDRVLILAHRGELLNQAATKLEALGVDSVVEKDARQAIEDAANSILARRVDCVIGSVQTLRPKRLERWPRDYFKLIVTDESHHAPCESYGKIYEHFADAWHLGVTATADRLDRQNLGGIYKSKAFEYSLADAINDGYLCRLRAEKADVRVDLRGIRTTAGDFNAGDLEDRISAHIEPLVNATRERIGDRKTIVFTPDVGSAQAFAAGLQQVGIKARAVWGNCPDRQALLDGFSRGEFQVLTNCALLNEGYDEATIRAVVLARPTKSRALCCQMIGRGTRISPGKEDCLILDFDWLLDRHDLVKPVELIAPPKADPELVAVANELNQSGETPDIMQAMEEAEGVLLERKREAREEAKRQEEERLRVSVRERPTFYAWTQFNPVGSTRDVLGLPVRETWAAKRIKATDKQVAALMRFGVPEPEAKAMSRRVASRHMEEFIARRDKGLATLKQVRVLIKHGMGRNEALTVTFADATQRLDRIFNRQAS